MVQSIKRLFQMAGEYKTQLGASILCAIASVAAGLLPYFLIQQFIIAILRPSPDLTYLMLFAALLGVCLICKTVLFLTSTRLSHRGAYRILRNVRVQLANKLTRLPLGYVLEQESGVVKKVMENDVEELERFLAHNIPETISSAVVPAAVLVYLSFIDWRLTLAMLGFIPLAVLFYGLMMNGSKEKMKKYYTAVDKMNAVVVEFVNGMKEIKAFNQSQSSFSRFREAIEGYRRYVLEWYRSSWPFMTAYYVFIQATLVTVLPVGLLFYGRGSLSLSELILFLMMSMGFTAPLIKLTEFADGLILVVGAEQNIHSILSEEEMRDTDRKQEVQDNTISFLDVNFSYDGATDVVKGVSFVAKEGQSTALIGPSGSGKSTIAKLICRFWDVSGGTISIGGVDVRRLPTSQLMEKISFVFQDAFLLNLSIADNIRAGKPEATDAEIQRAAKLARCHDFILKTPDGYHTLAGDAGNRLSGGERQRICIARAILKDAPILVLDEATASIDPDSEEQIQEAIGELTRDKTLLVIAHRIRTVMGFDQILVMKDGRICACGNHQELLNSSSEYKMIYHAYTYTESWTLGGEEHLC
ncbi:Xenobiotic-transporting ATPase [Syntrophobotulus glycolicus DSM 8271]|uniref:Xenobiotic-transporting ATPase n=1 Tax=Syntrophobotulus glycolicus (strain DSM 8271 / FlGlyR) TaxID=645991 RepID=F0SZM5_SYNGF|nr:ABC transporter ATP-binding protein [Syntrophobotulus glycolicus]ADY56111.1 Xenobiotic-transporting ATPase [Syntrophobotulus glycolicus DSM 8271]